MGEEAPVGRAGKLSKRMDSMQKKTVDPRQRLKEETLDRLREFKENRPQLLGTSSCCFPAFGAR